MAEDTEEWVEVASCGDDGEAEIIAGLLESEEIPVEIEGGPSPFPEDLGGLGMTRVLVPPDRAEEARALIAEQQRDADRNLADSASGADTDKGRPEE
jgi:Putative prokaryotic signal transducing protein